jgi:hypothetical protein
MSLGALAFLNPWLLAALAALPIIYWLLRTVPPRPRQVEFPPTRILVGLQSREKTPAKTPWWLMLLRLLAAALLIFALAEPVLNPTREAALKGAGPVVIAVDNGWAAAPRWSERTRMVDRLIAEAEAQNRPVVVLATASPAKAHSVRIEAPADARSTAAALQPQPFAPTRLAAATALEAALAGKGEPGIVWLTDGIDHAGEARAFTERLQQLAGGGGLAVIDDRAGTEPVAVAAGVGESGRLEAVALRAGGPARDGVLHAFSVRGQRLAEAPFRFAAGETTSRAAIELPLELRNQVARVEVASERSAGAVSLLDKRSQWQRVGLISGESQEEAQPLLAPLYYIQRALAPFAEIVRSPDANLASGVESILKQGASVLVLADIGTLTGEVKTRVQQWVERGGVLVRFAGPRLEKGGDDLLPVALRLGGRTLGGALSWSTPQPLAGFEEQSLFAGLAVPEEVTVSRQVLADPGRLAPDVAVWARLKDGTPLVTAARRGQGQIVLFHVTANSDWSSLPMSGLFVEMLRRIAALGQAGAGAEATTTDASGTAANDAGILAPLQTLDGFGTLKQPPPTAQAIPATALASLQPSLDHPPGYYGPAGTPRAVNVATMKTQLAPLPALPAGVERRGYESETATPLKPWLLAAALMLILLDIVAILVLQGLGFRHRARKPQAAASLLLGAVLLSGALPPPARAQGPAPAAARAEDAIAQKATSKVTLAYVLTGDAATDETSRLGLSGLNKILTLRTAVEPNEPMGVDVVAQEIAFFPVLYWPVLPNARALPEETLAKVDAYMKQGGLIVFDTKDQGTATSLATASPGGQALQRVLGRLDVPRLEPVPEDHVLTKAFYLLRWFPGRWDGGQLWVEADTDVGADDTRKARRSDGVTALVITSNDFASAWALDDRGRPVYPMVTGGEVQREMAFRAGVNIVMHALTGNYKADQVHVPALLERLGQ